MKMRKLLAVLCVVAMICSLAVVASADEVTTLYTGDTAHSEWSGVCEIYTTVWGGTLDPNFMTEGGYISIYFTGTEMYSVHFAMNGGKWAQLDCELGNATALDDGTYVATFTYDELVAAYGTSDFSTLGAVYVYTNSSATGSVTVTKLTYTVPGAAEEEPEKEVEYEEVEVEVTTKLADIDCTGWWVAHTEGVEITETPTTITYKSTTYADATLNWNCPIWILYGGEEAKVNGAGYNEYWVHRADNYGWAGGWASWQNTGEHMDALNALGVYMEGSYEDGCWDNWVADSQAGVNGTVTAYLDGNGNAVVSMTYHGVTNTMTVPVDTSAPVYLSLSGELCSITEITATTTEINLIPKTGDSISVFVALMAVSAMGIAVVAKKKEF